MCGVSIVNSQPITRNRTGKRKASCEASKEAIIICSFLSQLLVMKVVCILLLFPVLLASSQGPGDGCSLNTTVVAGDFSSSSLNGESNYQYTTSIVDTGMLFVCLCFFEVIICIIFSFCYYFVYTHVHLHMHKHRVHCNIQWLL